MARLWTGGKWHFARFSSEYGLAEPYATFQSSLLWSQSVAASVHCCLALDKVFPTKEIVLPTAGVVLIQYSSPHSSVPPGKGGCWKDRRLWHDHRWGCLPWESCPAPSQPTESALNKACPDANQTWNSIKVKWPSWSPAWWKHQILL